MLTFMDYIQRAFDRESKWNRDNSYSTLNLTAQSLLDFPTPLGLRLHISSLPTPNLATSYSLSTTGLVDGSLSYLYTSLPLTSIHSRSNALDLHDLITGYRHLSAPVAPEQSHYWEEWHRGRRVDARDVVLYGRVFLPRNRLEALYLRRTKPSQLLRIQAVSDASLSNGGTVLGVLQNDYGKYSTEYLYSTDSALVGVRGLYNFGADPRGASTTSTTTTSSTTSTSSASATTTTTTTDGLSASAGLPLEIEPHTPSAGLFSLGSELYYGTLNKSFGLSTGLRFTTLPTYTGFPYTMTLTLNPLMGNLSSSYSVKAGRHLALSTRFDFNFYSYESGVLVGMELWRMGGRRADGEAGVEWARRKMEETPGWMIPASSSSSSSDAAPPVERADLEKEKKKKKQEKSKEVGSEEDVLGILKARVDQDWRIGLLWEGRWKELLFTVGANVDLKRREQIFRGVGLEVQYSS